MCGRFTREMTWADVVAFSRGLELVLPDADPEPSWNVCPTQSSWVLTANDDVGASAKQMRWGLLPSWAKDIKIGASMINARLETVAGKPSFRSAWKARRCLVPASAYYEWRLEDGIKQPYLIHDADNPVLMFAGLSENWKAPEGDWLQSFAIITNQAIDDMAKLHDRTPLMLSPVVLRDWLHGSVEQAAAIALAASPPPALTWYPVGRAVSNPRNNERRLIEPLG